MSFFVSAIAFAPNFPRNLAGLSENANASFLVRHPGKIFSRKFYPGSRIAKCQQTFCVYQ
jgi:hypothetical protein